MRRLKAKDRKAIEVHEKWFLDKYDPELLDTMPKSDVQLLNYYAKCTDDLYKYLQLVVDYNLFVISNEIRAILGHMAEFILNNGVPNKKNLEKAYGHFRRLNLDAMKILCDKYDSFFSKMLKKQYGYDYRKVAPQYLYDFSTQYYLARDSYMQAQKQEKSGIDSEHHNILKFYYDAAVKYIKLKNIYMENKAEINKVRVKSKLKKVVSIIVFLLALITTFFL